METKYFLLAHNLNERHKQFLIDNQAHFRASLGSFSLISVNQEQPELGTGCNFNKYSAGKETENLILKDIKKINAKLAPKRPTPEKELQSWIINYALRNNYELPFDNDIKFISSEIAINNNANKKVVADILGYNEKSNELCIIELKSDRQETRLIEQVNNFENVINENPEFFTELLLIHGFTNPIINPVKVLRLVVWPEGKTSPRKKLMDAGVIEITFKNKYTFCKFNCLNTK